MAKYKYVAVDAKGNESSGTVEADGQARVIEMIKEQGWFPTSVTELGSAGAGAKKPAAKVAPKAGASASSAKPGGLQMELKIPGMKMPARVKARQLATFTRQLATLIDAGLPLLRGLKVLLKQEKNPALREAIHSMGDAIEGGSTFSDALAQHPRVFDNLYVNMVKAGEVGGVLDVVLTRLAEFMEKAEKIKNKVKGAMIYPVVILFVAISILTFLMLSIIPKFQEVFADMNHGDSSMPPLTTFVINCSQFMQDRWYVVLGVMGLLVVAFKVVSGSEKGRLFLDGMKINMPVTGDLFQKTSIARFARTLGTLLNSGVPILQALNIVKDTSGNAVIAAVILEVHDSVKEGDTITGPLSQRRVFPDMAVGMIDVGEETGALPDMLMKVADTYEDEVDTAVDGLTSVIEPILIIFLAVIVGTIVIAMFLPLLSLMDQLAG